MSVTTKHFENFEREFVELIGEYQIILVSVNF